MSAVKSTAKRLPFLRWAGSKRQLIPRICEMLPETFDRYVEPFVGSGCVFFHLRPESAYLTDFNPDLIQSYEIVRRHPVRLRRKLSEYPQTEKAYYRLRSKDPSKLDEIERAARFVFLNSFCFNGVYRTNKNGQFNVPWGTKSRGVPSDNCLRSCSISLRTAKVKCQDYAQTLSETKTGDFVYLDPPYTKSGTRNRGEYGVGSFSHDCESVLVANLRKLDQQKIPFLLSYRASSSFIKNLNPEWEITRIRVRRNVAGFSGARRNAIEILVRNYESEATCANRNS